MKVPAPVSRVWTTLRSLRARPPAGLRRLAGGLNARWTARGQIPAIKAAQAALGDFDRHSGDEFVALAEGLVPLDAKLAAVREQAGLLDRILRDHDEDRALASAFDLYKRSVDLAHSSIGMSLSQEEQMEQMESRLLNNRDSFAQGSLMFHVLVVGIRTEAARIDPENGAVFRGLADEIEFMAERMTKSVEAAFGQIEEIVHEAASGRAELKALQADLHARAQVSVKLLRDELDKIRQGLKPCVESSAAIAGLLEQVRGQTSELITSMQFQDIVRQRLEHVSHGFDDIAEHLTPGLGIDCGYVHQAAKVQQTHLASSRQVIGEATGRLAETGRELLDTTATLVRRLGTLEQDSKGVFDGNNVHGLFRRETENLVAIADQSEVTNQRIQRLFERIEASVKVFFTDIRSHELEVVHVSLNSQIAAARVSDAGALSKLAEEIARLASHTASLTQQVGEQLNETLNGLRVIRAEADAVNQTIGVEKAELSVGVSQVGEKLARLNDGIQTQVGTVVRQCEIAHQSVERLLPRLQLGALVAPAFAPAEALCERLLGATAEFSQRQLGAEGEARLARHRSRYTMKEEHATHLAVAAPAAVVGAVAASGEPVHAVAAADDGLELFEDFGAPVPAAATGSAGKVDAPVVDDGVELF